MKKKGEASFSGYEGAGKSEFEISLTESGLAEVETETEKINHPLEGKFIYYAAVWYQVVDGKLHRIVSAWALPADREVVSLSPEEFESIEAE